MNHSPRRSQISLTIGKEYSKAIAALKSQKTSLIRKRQLMRTTLGDYRTKMANEEKKLHFGNDVYYYFSALFKVQKHPFLLVACILLSFSIVLESSVKMGDIKRARRSTYIKTKRRDHSETSTTSKVLTSDIVISNHSESPNMLVDMLKSSGLKESKDSVPFRFDFQLSSPNKDQKNDTTNIVNQLVDKSLINDVHLQNLPFKPSDNSFRFNFQM